MIDIHTVINFKAEAAEVDNMINRDFFGIKKPLSESERINYNLVPLVLEGAIKYNRELNSDMYWCNECQTEHRRHTPFTTFINTTVVKRHSKQLTELHAVIL